MTDEEFDQFETTLRIGLPGGGAIPAHRILSLPRYSGLPVYMGFNYMGDDLPPSCYGSVWFNRLCAYCGKADDGNFESDHIVPKVHGGANGEHNKAPACAACNRKKWHHLGWKTRDGRTGFFWDGCPGELRAHPHPRPRGAHEHTSGMRWPERTAANSEVSAA